MKNYGLVGYPLTQSFSQKYFTKKFVDAGIDAQYLNFSIESIGEFPEIIDETENLGGLNVTIPYKEKVMAFLDELDDVAKKVKAVNVIKFIKFPDTTLLKGYNSDVVGFELSLLPLLKPHHTNALVLGTGGASKAVKYVLDKLNISSEFVSRKPKHLNEIAYGDVTAEKLSQTYLIINTTPLGMFPHVEGCPGLPFEAVTPKHLFYDLIYNPAETLLLTKAKQMGAEIKNGEEMLILQAEEAWRIWNS